MSLTALQYGLAGLSAILFTALVGLLRAEQKRNQIRQQYLHAVYGAMALAMALIIVLAAVEVSKQMHDTTSLEDRLAQIKAENAKLIAEKSAMEKELSDKKSIVDDKALINAHLSGLSNLLDLKQMYFLSEIPAPQKQPLQVMLVKICNETEELRKISGGSFNPQTCAAIDQALR